MADKSRARRWPWRSLVAAIIFFALGIGMLFVVPTSPINRSHTTTVPTPGQVSLPPAAPTTVPTAGSGTASPIGSPVP